MIADARTVPIPHSAIPSAPPTSTASPPPASTARTHQTPPSSIGPGSIGARSATPAGPIPAPRPAAAAVADKDAANEQRVEDLARQVRIMAFVVGAALFIIAVLVAVVLTR